MRHKKLRFGTGFRVAFGILTNDGSASAVADALAMIGSASHATN